ncbi:MAG: MFS transporter [Planctomyces sp.]|nr:MFS transporter [Planctomyces sp.]
MSTEPGPEGHDPYLAFRIPTYRVFAASYILAVIGSQILATAVQWDIYALTKSKLSLAWIGATNAIPLIALSLPAGHVVDVMPRRKILLITQVILIAVPWGMAIAVHYATDRERVPLLYVLSALNAITLTFARPARVALLPNLIPRSAFANAFTWNSSLYETSSWVGPAIAGFLLTLGVEWAYWASGLCVLFCLGLTLKLPSPPASVSARTASWQSLVAGVRFVWRSELLLAALSLDLLAVLLGGAVYLLPVFAQERLFVSGLGYGFLRAAPALGAAMMAVFQAHYPSRRRVGRRMLWAVAGFGAATIVFGLSTSYWLSLAMLVLVGAFDNVSVVVRHTLVQSLTPDSMRGRVSAVNQVFIGASNELGGVESGLTAHWFGPVLSVVLGGLGTIGIVLGVAYKAPRLRRLQSLYDLEPEPEEPEAERSTSAGGISSS